MQALIPLSAGAERVGVPLRTMQYHAQKGNLWSKKLTNGHRLTTMKAIQDWMDNPKFHHLFKGKETNI